MGVINVLPKHVAELIAAGEVVERPSSAVKEITENAIDAGATKITVEIKNGGVSYIRVTDNGCGIEREDIPKVFINHATSKISLAEDLSAILTLGFRGEALASIAAVSKVELLTRTQSEAVGTRCCVSAGGEPELDDAGCPQGTTIVVRDLFYNVPARMKFLKKDVSEANAVAAVVERLALSHPEISVRFIREGKETLLTPGDGKLLSAVYAIYGKNFSDDMLPVSYSMHDVEVSGYICRASAARASRGMQTFFINGRFVKTRTAMAAMEEAYRNSITVGKFPSCVLNIKLNPHEVDVNVHPAKIEVRFVKEKNVFDAVYYACKTALNENDVRADVSLAKSAPRGNLISKQPQAEQIVFQQSPPVREIKTEVIKEKIIPPVKPVSSVEPISSGCNAFRENTAEYKITPKSASSFMHTEFNEPYRKELEISVEDEITFNPPPKAPQTKEVKEEIKEEKNDLTQTTEQKQAPEFKIIGEVFSTYILAEQEDKLLLVDKHAAHERILFEKLKNSKPEAFAQVLLSPVSVTLSGEEYSAVIQYADLLAQAGFTVEDFGQGTVLVREAPLSMDGSDVKALIEEIAGNLLAGKQKVEIERLDWLYHSIACRGAIKAGCKTPLYEQERLIRTLLEDESIRCCPHGRPVLTVITKREFEKKFGRV